MKQIVLVVLMAVAGVAFAAKPKVPDVQVAEQRLIAAAKDFILSGLKDPDAAKFRDVYVVPNKATVCGEFNAKNGFGAYVGYKRFIVAPGGVFGIEDDGSMLIEANWDVICRGDLPISPPK